MTQRELNRAVAHTTGERLSTVRTRGFSLIQIKSVPEVVNWKERTAERAGLIPEQQREQAGIAQA